MIRFTSAAALLAAALTSPPWIAVTMGADGVATLGDGDDGRVPEWRADLGADGEGLPEIGRALGHSLRVLPDRFARAEDALLALHGEHLLLAGRPLHEEPGGLLVLAALGHGQPPRRHRRAVLALGPAREQRVADLAHHLGLLRVLDHREERVGVGVHRRLALREDRGGLVPVVV